MPVEDHTLSSINSSDNSRNQVRFIPGVRLPRLVADTMESGTAGRGTAESMRPHRPETVGGNVMTRAAEM